MRLCMSELCNEDCERVGTLTPASMEAHLFMRFPICDRPMGDARRISCPAAVIGERRNHGHERFHRGLPGFCVGVSKHEALIPDRFEIDTSVWEVIAIGATHDDQVRAARLHVKFGYRRAIGQWREPLLNELRSGRCPKEQGR